VGSTNVKLLCWVVILLPEINKQKPIKNKYPCPWPKNLQKDSIQLSYKSFTTSVTCVWQLLVQFSAVYGFMLSARGLSSETQKSETNVPQIGIQVCFYQPYLSWTGRWISKLWPANHWWWRCRRLTNLYSTIKNCGTCNIRSE
jgi:hypothetical protein